jgi:YD repeat-containing protein
LTVAFDLLRAVEHIPADELSNAEFRVLIFLLMSANNRTYKCFPSMNRIAQNTGMARRTVQRHISKMTEMGLFEREEQRRQDGSRMVNCYRFRIEGVMQIGNGREVKIEAETAENCDTDQGAENGTLDGSKVSGLTRAPSRDWRSISQESPSQESIPPSSYEEGPPVGDSDLFGEQIEPPKPPEESLVSFVEREWADIRNSWPYIAEIRKIDLALAKSLLARGAEQARDGETPIMVWGAVFDQIRNSHFLTGRTPPGPGRTDPFKLSIGWLSQKSKFREVINGKYADSERTASSYDANGRRLTETDQAQRATMQRIRQARGGGQQG